MTEEEVTRQLTTFEELVKHLATKEDVLLVKVEVQKLKTELIIWLILASVSVGGALLAVMLYLNAQLVSQITMLQHLKP